MRIDNVYFESFSISNSAYSSHSREHLSLYLQSVKNKHICEAKTFLSYKSHFT